MRQIFLIRHGIPDLPPHTRFCLGQTDICLSPLGRMQAVLLRETITSSRLSAVFSSPLTRCLETAREFQMPVSAVASLAEQNMGVWDGLSFSEIRQQWPVLYEKRGSDPLLVPPGAELLTDVRERACAALENCISSSTGDIAIISHASVIQSVLSSVSSTPLEESRIFRPPYGGYSRLTLENSLQIRENGILPHPLMTPGLAESLLAAAAPGEKVSAHCLAVARKAAEISDAVPALTDRNAILCAAILHDVARSEPKHAEAGAAWLRTLGYPEIASLIRQHHDLDKDASLEAQILFISDKCIQEDQSVPVEIRFANSLLRCRDLSSRKAHQCRLETALRIREQINQLCGFNIVP